MFQQSQLSRREHREEHTRFTRFFWLSPRTKKNILSLWLALLTTLSTTLNPVGFLGTLAPVGVLSGLLAVLLAAGTGCPPSTPSEEIPAIPKNVVALAGNQSVTVTWDDVENAKSYRIYWSDSPGVTTEDDVFEDVTSPFVQRDVINNTRLYYKVAAINDVGETLSQEASALPATGAAAPGAPQNVRFEVINNVVQIEWDDVQDAIYYTLYKSSAPNLTLQNAAAFVNATRPYVDRDVVAGGRYFYALTATTPKGESVFSAEISVFVGGTPVDPNDGGVVNPPDAGNDGGVVDPPVDSGVVDSAPATPSNVRALAGDSQVTLSWDNVAGATSYTVLFATAPGNGVAVTDVPNPFIHRNLVNGTTYSYAVIASNSFGESAPSPIVQATPQGTVKGVITSTLPANFHAIVLLENLSTGESVFQVQVLQGGSEGTGVNGLNVQVAGPASGPLTAAGGGAYQANAPGFFSTGSYTFTVSGAVNGTITAIVNAVPSMNITAPTAGSIHPRNTDLPVQWSSSNSERPLISVRDAQGDIVYPALGPPDPGGVILPGEDISVVGGVSVLVSAAYRVTAASGNADLIAFGDDVVSIIVQ